MAAVVQSMQSRVLRREGGCACLVWLTSAALRVSSVVLQVLTTPPARPTPHRRLAKRACGSSGSSQGCQG